jgi:hypothetical protein
MLLGNWILNDEKHILLSSGLCKFFLDTKIICSLDKWYVIEYHINMKEIVYYTTIDGKYPFQE